jgi:hypothetical protein
MAFPELQGYTTVKHRFCSFETRKVNGGVMKRAKANVHFLTGLFVIIALIVCSPAASWALLTSYLDFNMDPDHPDGASISYAGGTLTGVNIGVDNVTKKNTLNQVTLGPVAITGGQLNFTALT